MAMPKDVGAIDTMIGFPHPDMKEVYRFITRQTKDAESKEEFDFPVEYMFKDVPEKGLEAADDPIGVTLREMDLWGVERGMIGVGDPAGTGAEALKRHPDRFIPSSSADPNEGMKGIRRLVREYETFGVRAVGVFPAGTFPQVAINDKLMYPIYAKCVELGIPVFCCAGIPGPRLKVACQHVELIDEVMYDFPELVFVTRHGCEPWTELAVKLMLKWPGLHYSTSAFAPKYYPQRHRGLRQHPRRRQDHLRRLLPHGPVHGADHDRDAQRRVQGRGLAQVPADQRAPGAGARMTSVRTASATDVGPEGRPRRAVDYVTFDADNHYYEATDAYTRHIDPAMAKRAMQWAEIDGRRRLLVGGTVNRFIPNPLFDPVAKPGSLDEYFRGRNPGAKDMRSLFGELEPIRPEYRDRDARLAVMDQQGLDGCFLFPTLGVGMEEALARDPEALVAAFRGVQPVARGRLGLRLPGTHLRRPHDHPGRCAGRRGRARTGPVR